MNVTGPVRTGQDPPAVPVRGEEGAVSSHGKQHISRGFTSPVMCLPQSALAVCRGTKLRPGPFPVGTVRVCLRSASVRVLDQQVSPKPAGLRTCLWVYGAKLHPGPWVPSADVCPPSQAQVWFRIICE